MGYVITAQGRFGKKDVDEAKDRIEAESLVEEYAMIYGPSVRLTYHVTREKHGRKRV